MRDAMNHFDQIQGGEAGESPQWALTTEPTQELVKMIVVPRDCTSFRFWRRCAHAPRSLGYRSDRTPCQNRKSVATPHILVFQQPVSKSLQQLFSL